MMPSAVASLALVVRASIPITTNPGKSARVMGVSFRSLVVRRWSFAKPVLPQSTQSTQRRAKRNRFLRNSSRSPGTSQHDALANDQRRTTNNPSLYFHHFFFFRLAHVFHLLDLAIRQLLDLIHRALLFVLGNLFVLQRFLDRIVAVAADVADRSAVLFQNFVQMLHHFLTALFGKRRHGYANNFPVVHRIQPKLGPANGFLDYRQLRWIKWLHND